MNIFFLDEDLKKSAEFHVDNHVIKMRTELAQLASTAHWLTGSTAPYKPTHQNHPSSIWTRESLKNYDYVVNLGLQLCDELEFRFKTKKQKAKDCLLWLKENQPNIPNLGMTQPRLAFNKEFYQILEYSTKDPLLFGIENYRNYYNYGKRHLLKWKNRPIPEWIHSKEFYDATFKMNVSTKTKKVLLKAIQKESEINGYSSNWIQDSFNELESKKSVIIRFHTFNENKIDNISYIIFKEWEKVIKSLKKDNRISEIDHNNNDDDDIRIRSEKSCYWNERKYSLS